MIDDAYEGIKDGIQYHSNDTTHSGEGESEMCIRDKDSKARAE